MDTELRDWAARKQAAERLLAQAGDLARRTGRAVVAAIPESVKRPILGLADRAKAQAAGFLRSADTVGAKIRDGACVVLGATAGPCVTQNLPELPGGFDNTVRVTAQGDLTVPLAEIGIPANLKIGAGSAVAVTAREGTYLVNVTGEATVFLNETFGADQIIEAGGTGPGLLQLPAGGLAGAWNALNSTPGGVGAAGTSAAVVSPVPAGGSGAAGLTSTGPSVAPVPGAVQAATGTADGGGAGGVGGGQRVEANAGIRGTTVTEWHFNAAAARTSCDGVGGLVTLLAGLGAAQLLPAPLNQAGSMAVQRGFMQQMTLSRFSVGLAGEVSVDLRTEGVGRLRGRLGGDISENVSVVRDRTTGELVTVRTRTITAELGAAALGPFTAGGLERFGVFLDGQGILRLTLNFEGDDIVPSTLGGAFKTTVGATNFDPSIVAGLFPPEIVGDVRRLLTGAFPGMQGPREVALSLTVGRIYSGLEPIGRELNAYFRGPIELINIDGVMAIVKRNLAAVTPANHAKLEVSATQRRELAAGATEGEGVAAGANARVEAAHTITRTLYNFDGADEVLEAAASKPTTPVTLPTPGDDKKQDETLHRAPDNREGATRLNRKAAEAEANPKLGLYGVSVFRTPLSFPHSKALRSVIETAFRVVNTLGPDHRTIVLPKPVTDADAATFNRLFGR